MTPTPTTMTTPSTPWRIGRRVLRAIGRTLAALVGLLVVLGLIGASYEAIAAARDAQRYPAPGQLVDVGGYRLHIQCVGTGSPTVVLDAGLGGSSLDWRLVQPELGHTTRVCAYDRAGMGWSDAGTQNCHARFSAWTTGSDDEPIMCGMDGELYLACSK